MRPGLIVAACALSVVGCRAKHEATTGKEFFEKAHKAKKEKDVETVWKMMSKRSQEILVEAAKSQLERAKESPEARESLKKSSGIEGDPTTLEPVALAKALMKRHTEKDASRIDKVRFVEERTEGDKIILVTQEEGEDKEELVLVKEDGFLRADMEATGARRK